MSARRHLFTELIISLVFFLLCTAVCLCLLARAHDLSERSRRLTQAVSLAQNAAQTYEAQPSPQLLSQLLGAQPDESGQLQCHYDEQARLCGEGEGVYRLTLSAPDGAAAQIDVWYGAQRLYQLTLSPKEETP